MKDDSERKAIIMEVASTIVDQNVDLSTKFAESQTQMPTSACTDNVNAYSFSLGLLFMEFKDAIREGDGDHVLLVWKYLFLLFKASGRRNYSIEALLFSRNTTTYYPKGWQSNSSGPGSLTHMGMQVTISAVTCTWNT